MLKIEEHIALLGMKVEDKVTGFTGVVTHVGFDLYGCVQVIVHPGLDESGKLRDTDWFDIERLKITSKTPVMEQPSFEFGSTAVDLKGPSKKPSFMKA